MPKAVRFQKTGGPEVLQLDEVPVGEPGPGQARVRHTAIGVNFVDTYQRSGLYPMQMPAVAGNEAAGVVEAGGPRGSGLKPGGRGGFTGLPRPDRGAGRRPPRSPGRQAPRPTARAAP